MGTRTNEIAARGIENILFFKEKGTFESLYKAQAWLTAHGFSYGSLDQNRPIGICKGEYILPQKWHNFSQDQKNNVEGVMESTDFREGEVSIIFLEPLNV